jgi:hypothetical protein
MLNEMLFSLSSSNDAQICWKNFTTASEHRDLSRKHFRSHYLVISPSYNRLSSTHTDRERMVVDSYKDAGDPIDWNRALPPQNNVESSLG